MSKNKLFTLTSDSFFLPEYINERGEAVLARADSIPMFHWPNGRWCFEANTYMQYLYKRGLARKIYGGTLGTYASYISHLIRFVAAIDADLHSISDNQFTHFINNLKAERRSRHLSVVTRKSTEVIRIGRTCLDFLKFIGDLHGKNIVGEEEQINAVRKTPLPPPESKRRGKTNYYSEYWHHHSFPAPDPKTRRLPISTDAINKIRDCISSASSSSFQKKRRYVMLKLLETTGGRRVEISRIRVSDIYQAFLSKESLLKIFTAKGRGDKENYRLIPISRHDLVHFIQYIEKNRKVVINKTCTQQHDDGYLLISEITGHKLYPNTITQEIHTLAKAANIEEQVCPKLFRHRLITKLFISLIQQHNYETADEFQFALMNKESLKEVVRQWTGHKRLSSLDTYIHLAFEELSQFKRTFNIVKLRQTIDSFSGSIAQIQNELRNGDSTEDVAGSLIQLLTGLKEEIIHLERDVD